MTTLSKSRKQAMQKGLNAMHTPAARRKAAITRARTMAAKKLHAHEDTTLELAKNKLTPVARKTTAAKKPADSRVQLARDLIAAVMEILK